MDEYIEVLNEEGEVLGAMTRNEAEDLNHVTHNALIFLFDPQGEVWIQKRAANKKHFPGLWDISAAGGLAAGEDPKEGAQRELKEETGQDCSLRHVETFLNTFPGQDGQTWRRMSHLFIGLTPQELVPNEEVEYFRKAATLELCREAAEHPEHFVPSFLLELNKAVVAFKQFKPTL